MSIEKRPQFNSTRKVAIGAASAATALFVATGAPTPNDARVAAAHSSDSAHTLVVNNPFIRPTIDFLRPAVALAQVGDSVRNTRPEDAKPDGSLIHPIWNNGENSAYDTSVGIPAGFDESLRQGDEKGQIVISGPSTRKGILIENRAQYIPQALGENAERLAITIKGTIAGDIITFLDGDGKEITGQVLKEGNPFIISPSNAVDSKWGIRIDGRDESRTGDITLVEGNVSKTDYARLLETPDDLTFDTAKIIDTGANYANQLPNFGRPKTTPPSFVTSKPDNDQTDPTVVDSQQAPEASKSLKDTAPIKKFSEAEPGEWFKGKTEKGNNYTWAFIYREPTALSQEKITDNGNEGELHFSGATNVGLDINVNQEFVNQMLLGDPEAKPAIWVRQGGQKGDVLKLVDPETREVVRQVQLDGTGFGGIVVDPKDHNFGFELDRANGNTAEVVITMGSLSGKDKDKRNSSVIFEGESASVVQTAATPAPVVVQPAVAQPAPTQENRPATAPTVAKHSMSELSDALAFKDPAQIEGWSDFYKFMTPWLEGGSTLESHEKDQLIVRRPNGARFQDFALAVDPVKFSQEVPAGSLVVAEINGPARENDVISDFIQPVGDNWDAVRADNGQAVQFPTSADGTMNVILNSDGRINEIRISTNRSGRLAVYNITFKVVSPAEAQNLPNVKDFQSFIPAHIVKTK